MNRTEILKIMAVMKAAYPNYYSKKGGEELESIVNLWEEMLKDVSYELASIGLKSLIKTRTDTFPPNIAELRESVSMLIEADTTNIDMWNLIAKACRNGYYGSKEEFNKLPPDCQRWVGNPQNIKELSQLDTNTLNTVVRGQFLKTIPEVKKTGKALKSLPFEVREKIQSAKLKLLEGAELPQ